MKTRFVMFVFAISAVIAVAFVFAALARAEQSTTSPFTVLSASPVPFGFMLAKGGHSHHSHHSAGHHRGHRGLHHHRHFRGAGYSSDIDSADSADCMEWNGYKYVYVCNDDN